MKQEEFDARGSVAKILCEVRVAREGKLSLLECKERGKEIPSFQIISVHSRGRR